MEKKQFEHYNNCMTEYYTHIQTKGDYMMIRGVRNGKEFRTNFKYEPTLFVEHHKDYAWTNIYGQNVKPITFETIKEAKTFADDHKDSNLKLYGFPNFASQYAMENYSDSVNHWKREEIRIFNIDIEVTSTEGFPEATEANYPITAIGIHDSIADRFIVFGDGKWEREKCELDPEVADKIRYIQCKDERELLTKFTQYWSTFPPIIITGWNVEGFDLPYIWNRFERLGMNPKKLSPWNAGNKKEIPTQNGIGHVCIFDGINVIDYMRLYKKNHVQESYRLDFIGQVELGERKLDYSEVQGLHGLYFENYQKFIDYNVQDVNLVKRLDEKLGLIDAQIMIAYEACFNFEDVQSPVRTWDSLINKELWANRQVPHYHLSRDESVSIPGGFVKTPQVGKHGWCMSFDLNSLYPHLIMQFNISPETINNEFRLWPMSGPEERVQKMLAKESLGSVPENHSISASGYAFSNEFEGIIPRLMSRMYNDRKKFKKQMIEKQKRGEDATLEHLRQLVMKLLLNSGYGALVNKYFRWFDRRMGESITLSGQLVIQTAERELNAWMNKVLKTSGKDYVIAIDTDSNYINMQPLVDRMFPNKTESEIVDILDKIAEEQIQKVLDCGFDETATYLNAYAQKMVMEREAIASTAVWTAKKRYAMAVYDMEGVRMKEPKIKIQGLEAIRSSTPQVCRQPLMDLIKMILLTDESSVQTYINNFRDKFNSFEPSDIAFPRTMNNISKMTQKEGFRKGTPPHIRGAITYNRLVKKLELDKEFEMMKNGEKGKFIWLMEPNNVGGDVISFPSYLPVEFNVEQYINKNKMFEKIILDPINSILEPIGWTAEKINTLEDFFS